MKSLKMTLLAAIPLLLLLLVAAPAQTNPARVATTTPQDAQAVKVTRNISPPQLREAENFTGSVGVELLQEATAPSRLASGRVTFAPGAPLGIPIRWDRR